jgi:hypothetical protein
MRWHQTIHQNIRCGNKIFFDLLQEIQIIVRLKENPLTVIAAIIDVIMKFRHEGN